MRVRIPLRRGIFFLCVLLFALVALLPLRLVLDWLALDERGLAAREARGSIWFGSLSEARFGSIALGDLTAELRTLPLLLGRARVDLDRIEEGKEFRAGLTVSRHSFGVDDATGSIAVGSAFAPLPVASLDLSDLSARFRDGLCHSAEGMVKASVAGDLGGLALPGGFSGQVRCEEGALLLPLVSQTGMEALNFRLDENGRYAVELVVRPADQGLADRLAAAGFALTPTGYVLAADGTF
ncbi:MAG: type II secretion system protein N [Sphingomonadaceae bacterium]